MRVMIERHEYKVMGWEVWGNKYGGEEGGAVEA